MSKQQNRKKIPFLENYKSLNRGFSDIGGNIEEDSKKILNSFFTISKRAMSFKIVLTSGNSYLNIYDEKVYESYVQLINYYRGIVYIYEEKQKYLENEKLKNILEGIYSVVLSRAKLAGETNIDMNSNPITLEKRLIIGKSTNHFIKNFDTMQNKFIHSYLNEIIEKFQKVFIEKTDYNECLTYWKNTLLFFEENCFEELYKAYMESVDVCTKGLNNIEKRKETYYYFELLRKEEEILGSMVKIQIDALEKEILENPISDNEKEVVNKILEALKESYQYFARDVEEILKFFDRSTLVQFSHTYEDFNIFSKDIISQINLDEIFCQEAFLLSKQKYNSSMLSIKNNIGTIYNGLYKKEISEYDKNTVNEELKTKAMKIQQLSDDVIDILILANNYFSGQDVLKDAEQFPIIKGIDETILIKVESILENKNKFVTDACEIIDKPDNDRQEHLKDDQSICNKALDIAILNTFSDLQKCNSIKNIKTMLEDIFSKCFDEEFAQKTLKNDEKQKEAISKLCLNFKKDVILYEISTFEEIMNYSVSKLAESKDIATLNYVDEVKKNFGELITILNKNNIIVIDPIPHEMFNGKEHEVLMVEKNEDFIKGEIIKLMNSGYKENNVVLMRANVIAAK